MQDPRGPRQHATLCRRPYLLVPLDVREQGLQVGSRARTLQPYHPLRHLVRLLETQAGPGFLCAPLIAALQAFLIGLKTDVACAAPAVASCVFS